MRPRTTLLYGGKEFRLEDKAGNDLLGAVLDMEPGSIGTVQTRLYGGSWLTITVGPGIPIAIQQDG